MLTIDKTQVDKIIDELLGNNGLTASPEVWYGLHKIKNLQPESAIPLSWIEKYIEWLKGIDNEFAKLVVGYISIMLKKWRDEQNERTD